MQTAVIKELERSILSATLDVLLYFRKEGNVILLVGEFYLKVLS